MDSLEQLGLALAFLGLIGLLFDIGEVIRSYRVADYEFLSTKAKFEVAKMLFQPWRHVLGTSATAPVQEGSIGAILETLNKLSAEIGSDFAELEQNPSASTSTELGPHINNRTDSQDLEAQSLRIPAFPSYGAKLKWSLGGRRRKLTALVDIFSDQVDMLYRLAANLNMAALTSGAGFYSTANQNSTIWLTDISGVPREFNLELCKGVGGFVLCLLLALKSSKDSLDPPTQARLLDGEFWVMPEDGDEQQLESIPNQSMLQSMDDARQGAILADTWEAKIKPGRRYKMVMPTTSGNIGPRLDNEMIRGTWNRIIRPILPDILQLSGWDR